MLTLIQKYPGIFLVIMIALLALGVWQFTTLAGFGIPGYVLGFAVALGFFLVYWFSYARQSTSAFKAAFPLFGIAALASPFHLLGVGGLVAAMLFYTMLPGSGMILALWGLSGKGFEGG